MDVTGFKTGFHFSQFKIAITVEHMLIGLANITLTHKTKASWTCLFYVSLHVLLGQEEY